MQQAQLAQHILMYFIAPLWLLAGLADWLCHRASDIEHTSGPKESVLHLVLLAEMGGPVLLALFFQVNALVIAVMILALIVHELTTWFDLRYASSTRDISPIEQQVHSFLEILPLAALILIVLLHWDQFLALFGFGEATADFTLRLKDPPLPLWYTLDLLGAVVMFNLLPYVEELMRGLRAQRSR
jgi:hypothetical protein